MNYKNSPGISIIIPTLNEERYIGRILRRLQKQTFDKFEVLIVDADSTDNTKKIAASFQHSLDLRIIECTKSGLPQHKNIGALNAKYEIMLFTEGKILFNNRFLESSLRQFISKRADVAIPKYIPLNRAWYYIVFFSAINFWFYIFHRVYGGGSGGGIFIKKLLHRQINGFSESLPWSHDILYMREVARRGKFRILNTKVFLSMRRFETEGKKRTMWRWIKGYFLIMLNQAERTNQITYKYGHFN